MFIIAEAGINHNNDLQIAKKLIEAASLSGANAVKFQAAIPELVCTSDSPLASYQNTSDNNYKNQLEMIKYFHLELDSYKYLHAYCLDLNIEFMCSAFDMQSLDFINEFVSIHKIPSGEINHYPYLQQIAQYNKKTILSTGMATLVEIQNALNVLEENGLKKDNIVIMHCTTQYPTDQSEVNLLVLNTLSDAFPEAQIGYSDHTIGYDVSIAASALGATFFEKHFTLDKNLPGPDHKASLSAEELKIYVTKLRAIQEAFGSSIKAPTKNELLNKKIVRRTIVASTQINKGQVFTKDNLICKRPEIGLDPMNWPNLIGKISKRNYKKDDPISMS